MKKLNLTADRAQELLSYDPVSGELTWKRTTSNRVHVGDKAGNLMRSTGYLQIQIDGNTYLAHRVAWLLTFGSMPGKWIDHINGCKTDNRLFNLREADVAQNLWNIKRPKTNKSGVKGVSWDSTYEKWSAEVKNRSKKHWIGYFDSLESATAAVREKRAQLHGQFANHG